MPLRVFMGGKIYLIRNLFNGMKYVGQTTQSLKERFRQHANRKDYLIGQAIRIDGKENFTIELLEECATQKELNMRERYWIKFFFDCITPKGYNVDIGGKHGEYPKVRGRRPKRSYKKFYTRRKWDAYPVLEVELQKRGIHGAQLAEVLGLKHAEITRKMRGEHNFSPAQMAAIRNFLGVDIPLEELFRRNLEIKFLGQPCIRHWDTFPVLEAELKRQGIKCAQIAELLSISANSVSRRMKGIYDFTPAQMTTVRDFLGVEMSVEELFRRAKKRQPRISSRLPEV